MIDLAALTRVRRGGASPDVVTLGYVQQVTSSYLVLTVGGGDVRVPMLAGTYTVGQFAAVARFARGWWALGPVTVSGIPALEPDPATAVAPPAVNNVPRPTPTKPKPAATAKPYRWVTVAPVFTGTYRGGWRSDTNELYQGDWTGRGLNTGFAGFSTRLTGLRADLTRTRVVRVRVKRLDGGSYSAQAPTVWTTTQGTKPSGNVTRLGSTAGPSLKIGASSHVDLPSGMADDLLDGTARGVAIYVGTSSPYVHLDNTIAISVYYAPKP